MSNATVIATAPVRRRLRGLVGVLGVALLGVVAGCSEDEQGGLQGASPGPDAVVGGEIAEIQLLYDDIITTVDGSVTAPDGDELSAEYVVDTDIRALIELAEPLTVSGEYMVRHEVVSVVGDRVEDSYEFTYEPSAAAPQLVFPPEDSGSPWLLWAIAIVGSIVLAVLIWRLVASMWRLRG